MSSEDRLIRALAGDPPIRLVSLEMTSTAREAARRHDLRGLAAVALGRALASGAVLATLTKGGERVTIQLVGDGPLRGITVDANDLGEVRGYVTTGVEIPGAPGSRLSTAGALGGTGQVIVHRDLGLNEIYQGTTDLVSGEIDEDIEAYLHQSEQIPSALRAEVLLDEQGAVDWAGAVLVQATPGATGERLEPVRRRLENGWLSHALRRGPAEEALAELAGGEIQMLEWRAVRFHCHCSDERVKGAVRTLGVAGLEDLLATQSRAEVTCRFCGQQRELSAETIQELIRELRSEEGE